MSVWDRLAALYVRQLHAPERTAGNIEHAGGMRGKDNIKPDGMDWAAKSHPAPPSPGVITCRRERALMTAYQTDSESGEEDRG